MYNSLGGKRKLKDGSSGLCSKSSSFEVQRKLPELEGKKIPCHQGLGGEKQDCLDIICVGQSWLTWLKCCHMVRSPEHPPLDTQGVDGEDGLITALLTVAEQVQVLAHVIANVL